MVAGRSAFTFYCRQMTAAAAARIMREDVSPAERCYRWLLFPEMDCNFGVRRGPGYAMSYSDDQITFWRNKYLIGRTPNPSNADLRLRIVMYWPCATDDDALLYNLLARRRFSKCDRLPPLQATGCCFFRCQNHIVCLLRISDRLPRATAPILGRHIICTMKWVGLMSLIRINVGKTN